MCKPRGTVVLKEKLDDLNKELRRLLNGATADEAHDERGGKKESRGCAEGEMGESTILMNTGELSLNCDDKKVPRVIFV